MIAKVCCAPLRGGTERAWCFGVELNKSKTFRQAEGQRSKSGGTLALATPLFTTAM